jgi:hypothetical protein
MSPMMTASADEPRTFICVLVKHFGSDGVRQQDKSIRLGS